MYKESIRAYQDGNNHILCTEASAAGVKSDSFGASAEAKYGVGAKAAANVIDGLKAKVEARYDLVDLEVGGLKSKIGLSADTSGSIGSNGIEAKVAGIGFKVGKEVGVSLPFGEISFDLGKLF
ncbi:hypothetical protein C1646_797300 [Rhizophagus diaphanus]|nr:hypothetical protein C1646_797300 [Rhizophagus diaphanus] [Rhizophagus sp. MUCL 43196]